MSSLQNVTELFAFVENEFPQKLREDGWYLTATGALLGSGQAGQVGELYTYLTSQPQYQTPAQRQALMRRLREAIIKCIILVGIPAAIEALMAVAKLEQEQDKDYSFSREGWQADEKNKEQALSVLHFLYRDDFPRIMALFDAHKDLPFISTEISYGLFLANHSILDLVESELVILPAIMCQNLVKETSWHLRGCVRAGISREDVETIQQSIEEIAKFGGLILDKIGRVADVEA